MYTCYLQSARTHTNTHINPPTHTHPSLDLTNFTPIHPCKPLAIPCTQNVDGKFQSGTRTISIKTWQYRACIKCCLHIQLYIFDRHKQFWMIEHLVKPAVCSMTLNKTMLMEQDFSLHTCVPLRLSWLNICWQRLDDLSWPDKSFRVLFF